LLQTDVAATVTAHVASGVQPLDPNAPASLVTLGTAATGYTGSAEGSITATRVFDVVDLVADSGSGSLKHSYQFTKAEQAILPISKFLRVRSTTANTVNMHCWIVFDE